MLESVSIGVVGAPGAVVKNSSSTVDAVDVDVVVEAVVPDVVERTSGGKRGEKVTPGEGRVKDPFKPKMGSTVTRGA